MEQIQNAIVLKCPRRLPHAPLLQPLPEIGMLVPECHARRKHKQKTIAGVGAPDRSHTPKNNEVTRRDKANHAGADEITKGQA
eukprot:scaffold266884_cov33-Tisochrysis_lutea.AAC.2